MIEVSECWLCQNKSVNAVDDCSLCIRECPLFGVEKIIDPLDLLTSAGALELRVESLQSQLKRERELCDELIVIAERAANEHGEALNMNSNDELADLILYKIAAIQKSREL